MLERLIVAKSTETPTCRCGSDMKWVETQVKAKDTAIKIFRCSSCEHEMRLMVWIDDDHQSDAPAHYLIPALPLWAA